MIELEPEDPAAPSEIDRLVVIVDQESGLPVRTRATRRGRLVDSTSVRQLAVNEGISRRQFRIEPPPGAEIERRSEGFRRVPVERVEDILGYEPLVPDRVPDGYALAEVAVAEQGDSDDLQGRWSRDVVALSYRRGFDQLIVTTRRAPGAPGRWSDPFDNRDPEPLELSAGVLAGARGELDLDPRELPHLWALGDGLVLTVAGPLGRQGLIEVAESLEPNGER